MRFLQIAHGPATCAKNAQVGSGYYMEVVMKFDPQDPASASSQRAFDRPYSGMREHTFHETRPSTFWEVLTTGKAEQATVSRFIIPRAR
ncbi:hypothetical protein IC614_03125 [Allosphingosinicella flava]|uniref:Uncharacterized protein n=1 Tax=Allosphingosinicella flava TaxID=2771430 RepID=A0A7T2GKN5_9SPHN|nr:hypothetical protein [Sphingosinicella flava]QPQ55609.1 hypothetical protein IC614_03125 [Sphingosinicella flava]